MGNRDDLIALLEKDERRNINILNFVKGNPVFGIEIIGGSALIRGRSDRRWVYISSADEDELADLAKTLDARDEHFAAIEDWMVPILRGSKQVVWDLSMMQFILPDEVELPQPYHETRPLSPEDAEFVFKNSDYQNVISTEYVQSRIANGPSVAVREEDQPVAWAMTQDDGAMGFLYVLEHHRSRGYGRSVTVALSEELRRQGRTPFVYIEDNNQPAIRLVSRLGFEWDKNVHWFRIRT